MVVDRDEAEEVSEGGIELPIASIEEKPQSRVVAVGPGVSTAEGTIPVGVEVGAHVVFSAYAGTEVEWGGGKFIVMHEDDLVCVLRGD